MELGDRDVSHVCVPTAHIVSHTEHTGVGRAGGDGTGQSDPPRAAVPVRQWAVAECAAARVCQVAQVQKKGRVTALLYTVYIRYTLSDNKSAGQHTQPINACATCTHMMMQSPLRVPLGVCQTPTSTPLLSPPPLFSPSSTEVVES